jgi:cation:H+ antiporter
VVVGTSIGSLVAQIGFVLGIGGIITRLTLPRRFVLRHGAALLGATLLLFAVALDGHISRFEGLALVAFYLLYVTTLTNGETGSDEQPATSAEGGIRSWAGLIIGLGVVIGSSEITVNAVVSIAYALDISEALISVLIIGLGTSLPELSISIAAILKNRSALSVGNIIGSNILDTLLPIGLASLISTVSFERQLLFFDLPFIFVLTSVVLGLFLLRRGVRRPQGIVILGFYAGYVLFKLSQI